MRVEGSGFRVWTFMFGVPGLWFSVWSFLFWGFGFGVSGLRFPVSVSGLGFRVDRELRRETLEKVGARVLDHVEIVGCE